ncbi:hypothetical protein AAC387_Pa06g2208 [Persea americana]
MNREKPRKRVQGSTHLTGRWQSAKTANVACCCKWTELQKSRLIAGGRDWGSKSLLQRRKEGVLQIRTCMMVPQPPTLSDRSHRHLPKRLTSSTSSRCPDQSPTALPLKPCSTPLFGSGLNQVGLEQVRSHLCEDRPSCTAQEAS